MKPRIRILYEIRRPTAAEQLERRARAILIDASERRGERSLTVRTLERRIALALGQLCEMSPGRLDPARDGRVEPRQS